jgi:plasmid stability protein
MASLTIKGIPEELCERLRRSADENRRSMNREAIVCLERALAKRVPAKVDVQTQLARIRELRESLNVPPLTDEMLREAKEWGRP